MIIRRTVTHGPGTTTTHLWDSQLRPLGAVRYTRQARKWFYQSPGRDWTGMAAGARKLDAEAQALKGA